MGRQIKAIELALGAPLFRRQPRGLALTETGAALVEPARDMRRAAGQIALAAAGRAQGLSGTVRLTASHVISHYVLPPILARLRADHPEIEIELVPSDLSENLLFREADIALRMYRPTQLEMVTRHLGDIPLGLFASQSYLNDRGRPEKLDELAGHSLIGFDRNSEILDGMRAMGHNATRHDFGLRTDDQPVYWELVRAGCGLGFGQCPLGQADPTLEQVLEHLPMPVLPIWLTAHQAMRQTPHIRRVWDFMADELASYLA